MNGAGMNKYDFNLLLDLQLVLINKGRANEA
ncbi:MAG: hypothetical protein CSYNP_01028 [Syntrophus sp. SKADARSKE-3]|nr:hypothetical protein [Syntrophus sp. SKADARSKE-3]